jgi:hypothetical protein
MGTCFQHCFLLFWGILFFCELIKHCPCLSCLSTFLWTQYKTNCVIHIIWTYVGEAMSAQPHILTFKLLAGFEYKILCGRCGLKVWPMLFWAILVNWEPQFSQNTWSRALQIFQKLYSLYKNGYVCMYDGRTDWLTYRQLQSNSDSG